MFDLYIYIYIRVWFVSANLAKQFVLENGSVYSITMWFADVTTVYLKLENKVTKKKTLSNTVLQHVLSKPTANMCTIMRKHVV